MDCSEEDSKNVAPALVRTRLTSCSVAVCGRVLVTKWLQGVVIARANVWQPVLPSAAFVASMSSVKCRVVVCVRALRSSLCSGCECDCCCVVVAH